MKKTIVYLALISTVLSFTACTKKEDSHLNDDIQKIIDQTNTQSEQAKEQVRKDFEAVDKARQEADAAVLEVKKSTLNYVGKLVEVALLDENEKPVKSYLDFFELDAKSVTYKSKFENIMMADMAGICFSLSSDTCESEYDYKQLALNLYTQSGGRLTMPPQVAKQVDSIPPFSVRTVAKIVKRDADFLILEVSGKSVMATDMPNASKKIKITNLGKLSQMKHAFQKLTEDKSDRKNVTDVNEDLKKLSASVVQIEIDNQGSMLHGAGSGSGTGFYISKNGFLLTNNHVIDGAKECMASFKCYLNLRSINSKNEVSTTKVIAELMITDVNMDFALLKITAENNQDIVPLDIEETAVDGDIMTLGYPGDKGTKRDDTPLTYSFGKLVATFDLGYSTSMYIAAGASGSPTLNAANKKIVGIVSNGSNAVMGEDGSPGIVRPIQMINNKFDIDAYLNGKKVKDVGVIVQMLKVSKDRSEAQRALDAFDQQRTYLGVPAIKTVMLSHPSLEVRQLIMSYLEGRGFILGGNKN